MKNTLKLFAMLMAFMSLAILAEAQTIEAKVKSEDKLVAPTEEVQAAENSEEQQPAESQKTDGKKGTSCSSKSEKKSCCSKKKSCSRNSKATKD